MSAAIATVNIGSLQEWGNGDNASQVGGRTLWLRMIFYFNF